MSNLLIAERTDQEYIEYLLNSFGVERAHFTNGTYMYPADMIVPTTLAGFQYLHENWAKENDAFVIAVNSDVSMRGIMDEKNASGEERSQLEDQLTRAEKVALPLAEKFPDRKVFVMFYDEAKPTRLYDDLAMGNPEGMVSLHKWGYGTDPKAPKIEGAHNFSQVFGFPLPNDEKPVCYDITTHEDQTDIVRVVKLSQIKALSGHPYIAPPENKM